MQPKLHFIKIQITTELKLKIGAGNYPDLNSYSFDNCISSFKASTTSPGFPTSAVTVRLYADKNYGGRTYAFLIADGPGWNNTYTKDVPNLGDYVLMTMFLPSK